ncbi:MAG: carbohydrate ABC transporter permease [Anaerolinea sp.]|nr:carbohydrate ABC transporter permease [Anaerolinea sp.]
MTTLSMTKVPPKIIRRKTRSMFKNILFYLAIAVLLCVVAGPFLWMFISSISPQVELSATPPHWFPQNPTWFRYQALFAQAGVGGANMPAGVEKFLKGLSNSLIVSALTTLICVSTGTLAAYALARLKVPGKNKFMMGILSSQMLPIVVIIIPLHLMMQKFDMMDSLRGLVLLYTGFMLPTVIWIMHSYFETLPHELEEAAMVDGCTRFEAFLKVIIPLSGPGLVAVSAFSFLSSWNEFFMALIFTGANTKTITVTVTEFSSQFGVDYGLMATGGVIGSIPPLLLAFLLQRYIVAGLTAGSVKG